MLQNRTIPPSSLLPSLFAISAIVSMLAGAAIAYSLNGRKEDDALYDSYYYVYDWAFNLYVFGGLLAFALFYLLVPRVTGLQFRRPLAYLHWGTASAAAILSLWPSFSLAFGGPSKRFIDYEVSFDQILLIVRIAEYVTLLSLAVFGICIGDAILRRIRRGKAL